MQWDTPTDLREKTNTSIAGNVTKYSFLHTLHKSLLTRNANWTRSTASNWARWQESKIVRSQSHKISRRRDTARCFVSLNILRSHSIRKRSLKIIESGTIQKLGYGWDSHSIATVAVSLAVSTQYTNVMDTQPVTARRHKSRLSCGHKYDTTTARGYEKATTKNWHVNYLS